MKMLPWYVIVCTAVFFAVTAWYGRPAGLWNSPDETANAFWAERVSFGEPLIVHDALIALGNGAIHPRSMAVSGGALVPGSFTGLILLYGVLHGALKLPFFLLTPLCTLVAGILFGRLVGRLFDRRVGLVASILFFLHPALLYYAARGFFHNVLHVDLLIMAAACFVLRKDRLGDVLGGWCFGWAIFTRTSEAVWALPAFVLFLPLVGRERWRRLGWACVGAAVPVFLLLYVNAALYGAPFKTAYVIASLPAAEEAVSPAAPLIPELSRNVWTLPFGFDARSALRNAWRYGLSFFWWQSLPAAVGLVAWCFAFRRATRAQKTYALAAVLTAAWLAVFYGSWTIRDRLDFQNVTIGTSYVRYFLPAYVAMLPFAALIFVRALERIKQSAPLAILLTVIGMLTLRAAVFAGDESLRAVRTTMQANVFKRAWLLGSALPPGAVLMTERFDKLVVPDVLRVIPTADEAGFASAAAAAEQVPVYWYGLKPSTSAAAELEALAARHGLAFVPLETPFAGEALYALEPYE